jgi:hypothetical protein
MLLSHLHLPLPQVLEQCAALPEVSWQVYVEAVLLHVPLRHLGTEPLTAGVKRGKRRVTGVGDRDERLHGERWQVSSALHERNCHLDVQKWWLVSPNTA